MSIELIAGLIAGGIIALIIGVFIFRRVPKKLKPEYFMSQWKALQSYLKDKAKWRDALLEADKLLDKALKKRKFRGKSMGERMVAAQRVFSDNDGIWFAHNLCKKAIADDELRLKETDVKDALIAFRQALRDVGALPANKEQADYKQA